MDNMVGKRKVIFDASRARDEKSLATRRGRRDAIAKIQEDYRQEKSDILLAEIQAYFDSVSRAQDQAVHTYRDLFKGL